MNAVEAEFFINNEVLRAFPKWACTDWLKENWINEVSAFDEDTAKSALQIYSREYSHATPRLNMFIKCAREELHRNGAAQSLGGMREPACLIQCIKSVYPYMVGQRRIIYIDRRDVSVDDIKDNINDKGIFLSLDKRSNSFLKIEGIMLDYCASISTGNNIWIPVLDRDLCELIEDSILCRHYFCCKGIKDTDIDGIEWDLDNILPDSSDRHQALLNAKENIKRRNTKRQSLSNTLFSSRSYING